jgi:molybdopterin-containing oxidoreductase family membrane subunit
MLEKALSGDRRYWGWLAVLMAAIAVGGYFYLRQLSEGLGITGLSRDVTWGFYIAQFTFLVGVAASAVMVVLPYYLHNFKAFSRITILGEFLAIAAVGMCIAFITVDLGQPGRAFNIMLHPSPRSILFWDMVSLGGYLFLNALIARVSLTAERKGESPPKWIKPVIYLSIPWAVSIHTVTAFIYSGLAARPFWMTAILAPRFLATAFAAGPALLILLCLILSRFSNFDAGQEAIRKLAHIVTYAMLANIFFVGLEFFTALYSDIPEHVAHFKYMYLGLDGHSELAPWMWTSSTLAIVAALMLLNPRVRESRQWLSMACVAVIVSIWIEKGMAMVVTGFVPSPLGQVTGYVPTLPELMISLAIYCGGALAITVLYKIALSVRGEIAV